jgi:phosphoribosylanthranilate isomerase
VSRLRLKVTGITRLEDALELAHLGVDALGFHLVPDDPRTLDPVSLGAITERLPPWVMRVGVAHTRDLPGALDAVAVAFLQVLEIHGEPTPGLLRDLPVPAYPALPCDADLDPRSVVPWSPGWILLRAVPGEGPEQGLAACWSVAERAAHYVPVLLGGPLGPAEVERVVRQVRPRGLDLGQGVEREPGIIDMSRVEAVLGTLERLSVRKGGEESGTSPPGGVRTGS